MDKDTDKNKIYNSGNGRNSISLGWAEKRGYKVKKEVFNSKSLEKSEENQSRTWKDVILASMEKRDMTDDVWMDHKLF